MGWRWLLLVAIATSVAGCSLLFSPSDNDSDNDSVIDGAVDAPIIPDAGERCECNGVVWMPCPLHFDPCQIEPPGGALTIVEDAALLTDDLRLRKDSDNSDIPASIELFTEADNETTVALVSVSSFELGTDATLRIIGGRPAIFAVHGMAIVDGTIDASRRQSELTAPGVGKLPAPCNEPAATEGITDPDAADTGAGGGGGGGGNGGPGGDGGDVAPAGSVARGGTGGGVTELMVLAGGCPGAQGANSSDGDSGGSGGVGGGAFQISAAQRIGVSGKLFAGGAGGSVASARTGAGGGGGGAGGTIVLDSPEVTFIPMAVALAVGGGGGEGADDASNTPSPGQDGVTLQGDVGRAGGNGNTLGGDGGNGSLGGAPGDGMDGTPPGPAGGGGGGGGIGRFRVRSQNITGSLQQSNPPFSP